MASFPQLDIIYEHHSHMTSVLCELVWMQNSDFTVSNREDYGWQANVKSGSVNVGRSALIMYNCFSMKYDKIHNKG